MDIDNLYKIIGSLRLEMEDMKKEKTLKPK
jgi:hypothetical protein